MVTTRCQQAKNAKISHSPVSQGDPTDPTSPSVTSTPTLTAPHDSDIEVSTATSIGIDDHVRDIDCHQTLLEFVGGTHGINISALKKQFFIRSSCPKWRAYLKLFSEECRPEITQIFPYTDRGHTSSCSVSWMEMIIPSGGI